MGENLNASLDKSIYRTLSITIVTSLLLCGLFVATTAASASDTIVVLRDNIDNPLWTCDYAWDQDNKEVWIRGDTNTDSGIDTWCHSTHRMHGGTHSAWVAVVGQNSISVARGEGEQNNYAIDKYDANMTSFMRHSLSLDPGLGAGTLTFYYWADTMSSSVPGGYDHMQVSVSSDNSSYDVIWTQPSASVTTWTLATVSVPADTKTISFDFISGPYTSGTEWKEGAYVDDILVTQESVPSWSSVKALPAYSSAVVRIEMNVDTSQGTPENIHLYYRMAGSNGYTMYHDQWNTEGLYIYNEIIYFNATLTGGEGKYEFYTIASGGAVTELAPSVPDASTTVDMGAPTTVLTKTGNLSGSGWYTGPVTLNLTATDPKSGIGFIEYKMDDGVWSRLQNDLTISDEGAHNLSYRAVDGAGNVEQERTVIVKVDHTPPSTLYSIDASDSLILLARENVSGTDKTYYRLDGGTWTEYSTPLAVLGGSHQVLEYYSTDKATNTEEVRTLDLTHVPMSGVDLALGGLDGSHSSSNAVKLTWSLTDPDGLVDHFEVIVDGTVVTTLARSVTSYDLTGLSVGDHTVAVRAVDSSGNGAQTSAPLTISAASSGLLGIAWELWAIIAIVLASTVVLAVFLLRRKK